MLRFRQSAFEHGITEGQITEVISNRWGMTKWFKIHDDAEGNSQDMAVGFDAEGMMIEVGMAYIDDDEVVFHADNMTPAWASSYSED